MARAERCLIFTYQERRELCTLQMKKKILLLLFMSLTKEASRLYKLRGKVNIRNYYMLLCGTYPFKTVAGRFNRKTIRPTTIRPHLSRLARCLFAVL